MAEDEVLVETEPDGFEPVQPDVQRTYVEPEISLVQQVMNLNPWLLAALAIGVAFAANKIYQIMNEKLEENRSKHPTEKQIEQSIQMADIRARQQVSLKKKNQTGDFMNFT